MNPAEAGNVIYEEPDWRERYNEHFRRYIPCEHPYHAEEWPFEETLKDWRRFHATLTPEGKHHPASATDGVIALANLRIFPPRDRPADATLFEEQHDDHCWISISSRAWRIVSIEDRMLCLDSFGETKQIDLNRARWDAHTEAAIKALRAAYP